MEIEKLVLGIIIIALVGFTAFSFVTDYAKDASVSLDENYTRLTSGFESTLDEANTLGIKMTERIEAKGGFDITAAGFVLLNGMYVVAKLPFNLIQTTPLLITETARVIGIPTIYVGIITSLLVIVFIFGLISLLFRKDY